ncbi:MAG: dihydrodipicolinate reductase [Frankiales bacterium]|nr:dihydrodipicolinate reductase [Frankiales bacterium]
MAIKVIQWATGGVGRAAIEAIAAHPELELVGVWVHSPAKEGMDAGELAGIAPLGVKATGDVDALLALGADCICYAALLPDEELVCKMLASGANVVTPLGWVYPSEKKSVALREACATGQSSLHGTGIHPGGITERFPLMVSALTSRITHVRSEEFSDIRTYGAPDVLRDIMLFGHPPEVSLQSPMVGLLGGGFRQSIQMIADELGFDIDPRIEGANEVAVATAPIDTPMGVIEPGLVAAQRFTWTATVKGEAVITAQVNWLMGEKDLDPAWSFGQAGERFEVAVTGDPDVLVTFKGYQPETVEEGLVRNPGITSTAHHCVSAIPYVVAAQPGIQTYLDLPLIAGRAAPHLSR